MYDKKGIFTTKMLPLSPVEFRLSQTNELRVFPDNTNMQIHKINFILMGASEQKTLSV